MNPDHHSKSDGSDQEDHNEYVIYPRSDPRAPDSTNMTDRKAVIKNADMSEEMQQDAVDCATAALEKYNIEKVIMPS